jgi:hypothetical protein
VQAGVCQPRGLVLCLNGLARSFQCRARQDCPSAVPGRWHACVVGGAAPCCLTCLAGTLTLNPLTPRRCCRCAVCLSEQPATRAACRQPGSTAQRGARLLPGRASRVGGAARAARAAPAAAAAREASAAPRAPAPRCRAHAAHPPHRQRAGVLEVGRALSGGNPSSLSMQSMREAWALGRLLMCCCFRCFWPSQHQGSVTAWRATSESHRHISHLTGLKTLVLHAFSCPGR